MDIDQIIIKDYQQNNPNPSESLDDVLRAFVAYANAGGLYFVTDRVLIVYAFTAQRVCVFHCCNGGNGTDLTNAVNAFLDSVQGQCDHAATFYDNPAINDLVKYTKYPGIVQLANGGRDHTYALTFHFKV